MVTVYLLCGKVGSGKTTFASHLEASKRAVRLSVDEIMLPLFGPHMPRDVFESRLAVCAELLLAITERLVASGTNVVLDWGFWRKAERLAVRQRVVAAGASCKLIFLDTDDTEIRERLRRRNLALPPATYEISEQTFSELSQFFEPPDAGEVDEWLGKSGGSGL